MLETITDSYKQDLMNAATTTVVSTSKSDRDEFKAMINSKINTLKAYKSELEYCYESYGVPKQYDCRFNTDVIKEQHPGDVVTKYTNGLEVNSSCNHQIWLGHTTTENAQGKTILKSLGGKFEFNTLDKCIGEYSSDEYSFRKMILSKDNFFVMDQYMNYHTNVKVLAKKYKTKNELEINYDDSEISFTYGDAEIAISTETGYVTRTNFLTMDEVTEGSCETRYNQSAGTIYPRVSVDEKAFGFKLEYVSY